MEARIDKIINKIEGMIVRIDEQSKDLPIGEKRNDMRYSKFLLEDIQDEVKKLKEEEK
jgi:hypothetical protein